MDTMKQYEAFTGLEFGFAIRGQSLARVTHMVNLAAYSCRRVLLSLVGVHYLSNLALCPNKGHGT